ncbi:MAG: sugar phosphorylase [Bacteroidales bacterium]
MKANKIEEKVLDHLNKIYSDSKNNKVLSKQIVEFIKPLKSKEVNSDSLWNEEDIFLITYGDSIIDSKDKGLYSLEKFVEQYLHNSISHIHILPFFPYSSDDGFSIIDYYKVNPKLGNWKNINSISKKYKLMADLVINHISAESSWFKDYLENSNSNYKDYFIEKSIEEDLSMVVRPRTSPLLTKFKNNTGEKYIWTTFSEDQIDLNFHNPEVLLETIKILCFYIQQGVKIIRLDAIAFLWKESNTDCLHRPQTHEIVKLIRSILYFIDPSLLLITETNVPNKENLSYFGNEDEANMVYQFSLPPLLLHGLYFQNTSEISKWLKSLPELSDQCTFFNFTASHDGIGVRPLEGIVNQKEQKILYNYIENKIGKISYKTNSNAEKSPYELNTTFLDALQETNEGKDKFQNARFILSQTVMMTLKGIPAFYIHSILGTKNDWEKYKKTQANRSLNRKSWQKQDLLQHLNSESKVFNTLINRIQIRKSIKEFNPNTKQEIIFTSNNKLLIIKRYHKDKKQQLIAIFNFSKQRQQLPKELLSTLHLPIKDEISQVIYYNTKHLEIIFPYQCSWLRTVL